MKLGVAGSKEEFLQLSADHLHIEWLQLKDVNSFVQHEDIDAFFNLSTDAYKRNYSLLKVPVFINSVVHPLGDVKNLIRFNGWNGFIEHETWEMAGNINAEAKAVLLALKKKFLQVPDEAGFISARVIAMIINEAWFALGENISTETEIDIAMKLGTNYPYGPFEWGYNIGMKNIYDLLQQMALQNQKYQPAPLLRKYILTI